MPIRPELRKFYGREWREVVRPRILARAKNQCEQCGVPNRRIVMRGPAGVWMDENSVWWTCTRARINCTMQPPERMVRIVLTVAHLDHTPGHDTDDNLKALCQWCHLNYDKLHHKETRQAHKDAARPLLAGMEARA